MGKKIDKGALTDTLGALMWIDEDGDRFVVSHRNNRIWIKVNGSAVALKRRQIRGIIAKLQGLLEQ